ncbi:hypothetical protein KQI52_02480 [bacterium]|nr:hypothetical protein [bacterium]
MEKDGSLPPVSFDRRFDKPPQQRQNKKRERKHEPEDPPGLEQEPRNRPPDPERPSSIDLTA